ncbi:glycosyltransferase [Acetobacteraceae bacterium]|nr:glycosyltransferase [Acetobacteraceae bacterium]
MRWLSYAVLGIWSFLITSWGKYWIGGPWLSYTNENFSESLPDVLIVVPARNEEEHVSISLKSLLNQDYSGKYTVLLVDDESTDRTRELANSIAKTNPSLKVLAGDPRPEGWSGKLWALHQGLVDPDINLSEDALVLFTDADILHASDHISSLVHKASQDNLDLVSEMVMLQCNSLLEKTFIPAFVYFFALLYPFRKVANPDSFIAGAAGGTVLLKKRTLDRIGGIASIRGALIDDCALAARVKKMGGRLYLGCSKQAWSLRKYENIKDVWNMISRTAYVQLHYSIILLFFVLCGMMLIWFAPLFFMLRGRGRTRIAGGLAYLMACCSYFPTLKWFGLSPWRSLPLPLIAFFYSLATVGSAYNHYFGNGVEWHQRTYSEN